MRLPCRNGSGSDSYRQSWKRLPTGTPNAAGILIAMSHQ